MLEILMTAGKAAEGVPEADVIFLWDPLQAKDLIGSAATIAYTGGTVIDSSNTIDEQAVISFPATGSNATITFETPLNLTGLDWTIEWSSLNTNNPTTYGSEFSMYSAATSNGILARWGDSGFGNRLQFGNKFAAAADCYNIGITKASTLNALSRFAMVCKNNVISVFRNGVKQAMAIGTGTTYNQAGFPAGAVSDLRAIRLGYLAASVPALIGRHGRIRISKNALYTANYTPQPF